MWQPSCCINQERKEEHVTWKPVCLQESVGILYTVLLVPTVFPLVLYSMGINQPHSQALPVRPGNEARYCFHLKHCFDSIDALFLIIVHWSMFGWWFHCIWTTGGRQSKFFLLLFLLLCCTFATSLRQDGYLSVLQDRVLMETVGAVQELKQIVVSHAIASLHASMHATHNSSY